MTPIVNNAARHQEDKEATRGDDANDSPDRSTATRNAKKMLSVIDNPTPLVSDRYS